MTKFILDFMTGLVVSRSRRALAQGVVRFDREQRERSREHRFSTSAAGGSRPELCRDNEQTVIGGIETHVT